MSGNETQKSSRNKGLSGSKSDPSLYSSTKSSRGSSSQSHGLSSLESRLASDSLITSAASEGLPAGRAHQAICCRSLDESYRLTDTGEGKGGQEMDPAFSSQDLLWEEEYSRKGQSQRDFEEDEAHRYWTWDLTAQTWCHVEQSTGAVSWVPHQLD
ncbi:hypothetical protein CCUS01_11367 [Colletotrichum cuscutae]|uniref:Uncharacterized protein n=1 Tax=Colletotrichum cuscutae TaxID=1209917 RepID=A0AAI9U3H5_9PEZI|nr:hypothetical protein CCUS01_11367 [Colletotrichum cuscutae]